MENRKSRSITEEDISTVLQRYTATTLLAMLQEVAQFEQVRINWNELVKRSSTGISSPREYQMLWRHLAYRDVLLEKLEDGAEPLDDDSDLEYELETFPAVSGEASAEVAASVKVLIASVTSNSALPKKSCGENPLTLNIPNSQPCRALSEGPKPSRSVQGMKNTTIPVSIQKQPLPPPITSSEGLDPDSVMPPKKKRKHWSEAEDLELIAAVQKCGEGNWSNLSKTFFKGDRTASQLSQRWASIRKRQGNLGISNSTTGTQLSEAQLAARHALSLAFDMPIKTLRTGGTISSGTLGQQAENQTREVPEPRKQALLASSSGPLLASSSGPLLNSAASSAQTSKGNNIRNSHDDIVIKAAAVAAGARTATPSDAASLIKAAQAKNAVHIYPRGSSLIKVASVTGSLTSKSVQQTSSTTVSGNPASMSTTPHKIPRKDALPIAQNSSTDTATPLPKVDIGSEGGKAAIEPSSTPQETSTGEDGPRTPENEGSGPVQEGAVSLRVDVGLPENRNSDALTKKDMPMPVSNGGAVGVNEPEKGVKGQIGMFSRNVTRKV